MSKMTIRDNSERFKNITTNVLGIALGRMAKDIKQIAWITIPFLSGELQKQTYDEKMGPLRYRVIANKEYASYQERGKRANGTHVVRNYTTAGTGKGFLKSAGNKVCKDAINYLKQANSLIRL